MTGSNNGEQQQQKTSTKWMWLLGITALLTIGAAVWVFIQAPNWHRNYASHGAIGDFFNGMLAPFIAFISALLTFAAFYVQYQANLDQRDSIKRQEADLKEQQDQLKAQHEISKEANALQREALQKQEEKFRLQEVQGRLDRFEQRFFEMLKIHRENAEGFEIEGFAMGKKAFRIAALEVEVTMELLSQIQPSLPLLNGKSLEDVLGIAYLLVYWGVDRSIVGPNSMDRFSFTAPVTQQNHQDLMDLSEIYRDHAAVSVNSIPRIFHKLQVNIAPLEKFVLPYGYTLWEGHHYQWSHYLRHLVRMFEMLADAEVKGVLDREDALRFGRILRSQLSNDEQKLLYYYSLSNIGRVLWYQSYIANYIPFKNINIEEIPRGIHPKESVRTYLKTKGLPHADPDLVQYFDYLTDYV